MLFNKIALAAAAVASVNAQRPSDTPICDYYTTALLKNNTADNQMALLTVLVNTVVIGNYTLPNVGIKVPGILAPGEINGTKVNLLPYFSGDLASSNRGGDEGVSVNFLDGGGAAPLMKNKPADDEESNQYFLLTHLYQFFGSLLGCSKQGMPGFAAYKADASMYKVHKFMDLNYAEVTYFITQVGMAAASFGVSDDDVMAVGMALNSLFNVRCAPATTVIKAQGSELQSICIDMSCPLAMNDTCSMYDTPVEPKSNSTTSMMPSGTMTATGADTGTMMPSGTTSATVAPTGGAAVKGLSMLAAAMGFAAFML
ncbi:Fc.00g107390.m01.CDS01 [Cosmosporella sp. VM-42]